MSWGLRDYGTASWDGGDAVCDHLMPLMGGIKASTLNAKRDENGWLAEDGKSQPNKQVYRELCGKCGARRIDAQRGLEATPELYVERMVAVFREVRRVLRADGACWLNMGDSYAGSGKGAWDRDDIQKEIYVPGVTGAKIITTTPSLKPKDLVGMPWRLAFALQADGWWLRSDIIWSKPNPMPESVTDRPTKAHEYIFLLTKSEKYWYDAEAIREPLTESSVGRMALAESRSDSPPSNGDYKAGWGRGASRGQHTDHLVLGNQGSGRNARTVWEIATEPFPGAHFATFPTELARRCILAGCPEFVCEVCGKARRRIVEKSGGTTGKGWHDHSSDPNAGMSQALDIGAASAGYYSETLGWTDCGHAAYAPGKVLDPFSGTSTVGVVALRHNRSYIGIELKPEYVEMGKQRIIQDAPLLNTLVPEPTIGDTGIHEQGQFLSFR